MSDMRLSKVAEMTGLSVRYWQKRALAGDLPGAAYVVLGERRRYVVDSETFAKWWDAQKVKIPCQKTCAKEVRSGGTGSPKTASITRGRWKRGTSASLKTDLRQYEKA